MLNIDNKTASLMLKYTPILMMTAGGAYMVDIIIREKAFELSIDNKLEENKDIASQDELNRRELQRGTVVSISSAFLLNFVGALMTRGGVPDGYIILNYGFILGPVLGYMFDIMFATKAGLEKTKENPFNGFENAIENLANRKFYKYIVTVLLDMFISNPLQDALKLWLQPITKGITNNKLQIGQLVKQNFSSFLQSVVGILTFQAYTNDTRFLWAYLDKQPKLSTNSITDSTIMLALTISGVLFATYDMSNAEPLGRRLPYVIFAILYVSLGNQMGIFELPETEIEEKMKFSREIGLFIFSSVVLFGIGIPVMNMKKM